MKKRKFIIAQIFAFAVEMMLLLALGLQDTDSPQDAVAVNEALRSVQADWDNLENHENRTKLSYVVLDGDGNMRYRTDKGLSESVNRAIIHRDTILDIELEGLVRGKLIIFNDSERKLESRKQMAILVVVAVMLVQWSICIGYCIYLERIVIRPFRRLKDFARRVAGGNLDIPLEMDRENLFGAFTESFDILRDELKKARLAEAQANADKKELVAKLSHDIRTPVASIKAASEVGAALAENPRIRENYGQIIRKADQIDALVTNLFTATLEELEQIAVMPVDIESGELVEMLESADYFGCAKIPFVPACLLHADRLRLQQVFDNIFANAYKYGRRALPGKDAVQERKEFYRDMKIDVTVRWEARCLAVCIEDYGGGVDEGELPLLKEKFKRGRNAQSMEGAGLGLYISDYFMREMGGELLVENGQNGLRVTVIICQSK